MSDYPVLVPPAVPARDPWRAATSPILPPATIGILGGGQLGRMLGQAARSLGYGVVVLDPDPACPAAAVADEVIVAAYDDVRGAQRLADAAAAVTYELEHVALDVADAAGDHVPLRPGRDPLRVTQDRLAERRFLEELGVPVAPWRDVRSADDVARAIDELGLPLRLKASHGGYDGRSQVRVGRREEAPGSLERLGRPVGAGILAERELDFVCELSVVVARAVDGTMRSYPPSRNVHDDGILVEAVAPAPVDAAFADEAVRIAERVAEGCGHVGVLTVELFVLRDGSLVANEIAPRVHNSGHWTIEGAVTSQFAQHVRAICGLPLGSLATHGAAAMVNLLGVGPRRPARLTGLDAALSVDGVSVHVYGKREVFERRKMGHVTAIDHGGDTGDALARAREAAARLGWAP